MAGSSGGLRGSGSARITFFVFLDIITAVTGILILVILLFALRAGNGVAGGAVPLSANGGNGSAGEPALGATLAGRLRELESLAAANHRRSLELTDAENTPDLASLRAELAALRATLAQAQGSTARADATAREKARAEAGRDAAAGLTANRQQIERARDRLAQLGADNADKRQRNEALEQEVKAAESRLLASRTNGKHKLWLIPELPSTSKTPLLIVVSGDGATIDRFNQPDKRLSLNSGDGRSAFRKLLGGFRRLDDYLVFYVKPSGIDRFDGYLYEARDAGFEVGYDAVEEDRELVFAQRPD